jgi:flagellar basal-body rod protein FlgB
MAIGNTVDQIYLFGLSSQRAEWLASRQAVVAENIANVNTPGYKAKDISGFSEAMESTQLAMANTDRLHMVGGAGRELGIDERPENSWDITHSGNSVTIEQEMLKSGEVAGQYTLNASIAKAFHRFFLTSVKG